MKRALITGITGQDGYYLKEFLLRKDYRILGVDCRAVPGADDGITLEVGDISDPQFIGGLIHKFQPDEIYNLASQTRPDISAQLLEETYRANLISVSRMLESVREMSRPARFFQASSSEIFGNAVESPQTEQTPVLPRNPYGISKAAAHFHVAWFRHVFRMFACNGILYNHESPRRAENYVTRKITLSAARIKLGLQEELVLGSLDARRDWGYAPDYVQAMWMMLQAEEPDDYIIATGHLHTVQDLLEAAFEAVERDWRDYVKVDPQLVREEHGRPLVGNAAKARKVLRWEPSISFNEMIRLMVENDLAIASKAD